MFVPFTKGSQLARRMRESELTMEQMSGYKLKVVERGNKAGAHTSEKEPLGGGLL